jgi:hypothetical protein
MFRLSRDVRQEAIHGRAQIGGLIRQVARCRQYEVGGTIGVLGRGGRSSDTPGDAFRSGGRMPDAPRYFARRRVLLADGLGNRRREAINLIHDRGDGADIVEERVCAVLVKSPVIRSVLASAAEKEERKASISASMRSRRVTCCARVSSLEDISAMVQARPHDGKRSQQTAELVPPSDRDVIGKIAGRHALCNFHSSGDGLTERVSEGHRDEEADECRPDRDPEQGGACFGTDASASFR